MPTYVFQCKKCDHLYEELTSYDSTGKYKGVKCPACRSARKEQRVGRVAFQFTNPVGTDRWNSESTGHDYRFHHNLPNVIEQRKQAELRSHMGGGEEIYRSIDDLNKDQSWGEAK